MKVSKHISLLLPTACVALAAAFPFDAQAQSFDEYLDAARSAYEAYDFTEAARQLANAKKKMSTGDEIESEIVSSTERQINLAKSFIRRVEQLEILDSISVSKADFFKAYRLPGSAGSLEGPEGLPYKVREVEYVFTNEDGDFKMWAQPDSTGFYNIAESILLTDGTWSKHSMAPEDLGGTKNAEFPFMMADGVTLYFASDGEGSIGGYDIFIATRDPQTGEYLQPQNIGMPYNSPFDDYLLAIDEENGVGWWATDRNQLGDNLTVYLYKLNDTRTNYDPDEEEDIAELALISDFRSTQDPDEDYNELLSAIKSIGTQKRKRADFHFPMSGGRVYTTFDDFQTSGGRTAMKRYLDVEKHLNASLNELSGLRHSYHKNPSPSLKQKIRDLESQTEKERDNLKTLRNEVYRAEGN
ncbi:MAG: hypothetical protein K2G23_03315 [Muribaculaceae bacterium]|nr:hypothetical protein [Muribaculaceae bacterium]